MFLDRGRRTGDESAFPPFATNAKSEAPGLQSKIAAPRTARHDKAVAAVIKTLATPVMPFASLYERDLHFTKHGQKFGARDAREYERMADRFMYGPMDAATNQCIRPEAIDRVRFGFVTHYEGIARQVPAPEVIRTFYPVRLTTIARRGGEAAYFVFECKRRSGVDL